MSMNLSSKIVSKFGSPNSRIPLAAKDIFNSAGYTYFSYDAGGKTEAKDRLADEIGTGAIWLGGIPLYRKLIDKTVFKKAGISPDVDIRVLKDPDRLKKALDNAPTDKIKEELQHAADNFTKTKNLNMLKFGLALGLTMLSYGALTKAKQYMTKKNIEKEFNEQLNAAQNNAQSETSLKYKSLASSSTSKVFEEFTTEKSRSTPSFGALNPAAAAADFVLNPIKNMVLLDGAISAQRIACSRTKEERKEYAIKESAFLFFVYGADNLIRKGLDAVSSKVLHTPASLDAEFLSSSLAEKVLNDKECQKNITDFVEKFAGTKNAKDIYNFIFDNPDHIVVKAAQKSGLIPVVKNAEGKLAIDSRKFIDTDKIKKTASQLKEFAQAKGTQNTCDYLNKVKAVKVASTFINIAACCFALGYAVPKFIYNQRAKNSDGERSFQVKEQYLKELKEKQKTL